MKYTAECLWILIFFTVAAPVKTEVKQKPESGKSFPINEMKTDTPVTINAGISEDSRDCEEEDRVEPCEENNRIIDDLGIRQSFYELWQASGTDLPLSQRSEQGGWIVSNGSNGYEVIPFPKSWSTSPCEIGVPNDFLDSIPPDLVGVVHTHPFFKGDDTTASDVCGEKAGSGSYASGGNSDDLVFLIRIANHMSDFCIKWYIIDGNHVISMNTFRHMVFYPAGTFFQPVNS